MLAAVSLMVNMVISHMKGMIRTLYLRASSSANSVPQITVHLLACKALLNLQLISTSNR
jgi:hypothetical protein